MKDEKLPKSQLDRWWSLRLNPGDLAGAGFEGREAGDEANARDLLYVQNAFATLSAPRQLLWYGARAGLQAGSTFVAVFGIVMVAIMAAAYSVDQGQFATLYGDTPLVGTVLEPLWPLLLSMVAIPFYGVVGAAAALALGAENRWRRALHHYFEPIRPRLDQATFVGGTAALLVYALAALGVIGPESDPFGLFVLIGGAGGLIGLPVHAVWRTCYLRLIRERGTASLDEISAHIRRQSEPTTARGIDRGRK